MKRPVDFQKKYILDTNIQPNLNPNLIFGSLDPLKGLY